MDLLQVSLAGKMGEGIKVRETCNTWQPGSLAGQNSVQSASFYRNQYPIICLEGTMIQLSEALRYSLTMTDSTFNETVDNNPAILENVSKAKYYKSLSLFSFSCFFPRERLVASPYKMTFWLALPSWLLRVPIQNPLETAYHFLLGLFYHYSSITIISNDCHKLLFDVITKWCGI